MWGKLRLTLWEPFVQGDAVYLKKSIQDEAVLPLSLSRHGDETPRMMSSASSDRSEGP
jgi:hypothetical protein